MDESILADVKIPASGTAFPIVGITLYEVLLKLVVVGKGRKRLAAYFNDFLVQPAFAFAQRPQLAGVIVNDTHRRCHTEFLRPTRDYRRVFRLLACADHGIDVYLELRMLGQTLQFAVEHFQALFDTSSGSTLSMLICRWSRPARFKRLMRSGVSRYPLVIKVA